MSPKLFVEIESSHYPIVAANGIRTSLVLLTWNSEVALSHVLFQLPISLSSCSLHRLSRSGFATDSAAHTAAIGLVLFINK